MHEMGETGNDQGILKLRQKLLRCKAYLEDEEFVCDFLDTTIEDRMEKEELRKREQERRKREEERRKRGEHRKKMEEYRKEIEELRKRAEERRLELRVEEESRLKTEEEAKAVEERRKRKEERKMNERIALEEEMRVKKDGLWKSRCDMFKRNINKERVDLDDNEIEEKTLKLPKRKLKNLSRITGTELQQKVNLKASSNPQHWSFKRKYSQDKGGIEKLAWIKRIGIIKVRQSLREREDQKTTKDTRKKGVICKLIKSEVEFQKCRKCGFKRRVKPKVTILGDKAEPRAFCDRRTPQRAHLL
ncbi:putative splicing factor 3b subunit 2 [Trichonephila inaurata madagascariensis]|uniref:Putative splicing factor 3b subunit 2 n=1 Tax=Trichonephila inaurata madagascariensis TaxID=2747483 RepID=A0A8X6KDQ3_9ARAC|nr:putative splicing factor 3b subunit 2 [Trichonephila inaurata madagascariensis]